MPCCLFTFHAYGTWMPDRKEGYVARNRKKKRADDNMAARYRSKQNESAVYFSKNIQNLLIDETLIAAQYQDLHIHYIATDTTHVHILLSWHHKQEWKKVRKSLGTSLTQRLNREISKRTWFIKSPSCRHVEDKEHFIHLFFTYLPSHRGINWREQCDKT